MARVSSITNNFISGEVTPRLYSRIDLNTYNTGCKTLQNMLVYPHGGITKRPGTKFISYTNDGTKAVRLVPFQYSTERTYILEFGDKYIKFYKDQGELLTAPASAGGVPVIITSPYAAEHLFQLKYVQTANVMYLTHPDYPVYKLFQKTNIDWRIQAPEIYAGPFLDQNRIETIKITPSAKTGTINVSAGNMVTNGTFDSDIVGWDSIKGVIQHDTDSMKVSGDGVLNYGRVEQFIETDTNYDLTISGKITGNPCDVIYSSSPSATTWSTIASAASGSFTAGIEDIESEKVYLGFINWGATPANVDDVTMQPLLFESLHLNSVWKISGPLTQKVTATAADTWSEPLAVDAGKSFILSISGTFNATVTLQKTFDDGATWLDFYERDVNTSIALAESDTGVKYRVGVATGNYTSGTVYAQISVHDQYGYFKIDEVTSSLVVKGEVKKELPTLDSTYKWSEGAWSDYRGYPACAQFYDNGRLVFAGSKYRPQTIIGSKVDDFENFENVANADDEAYSLTINSSDVNTIRWMTDLEVLLLGTHGGEWRFGSSNSATTPTNAIVKKQTSEGSEDIVPVVIGHHIIYVQRGGTKLRRLQYNYETESFISPEMSMKAEHLLRQGIKQMAFASKPDYLLYMITDEGNIITLTYNPLITEINAYTQYITTGNFESVAVIPGDDRDEVWCVIKRTVNGQDRRMIEILQNSEWSDRKDAWYVDSGLAYNGESKKTFSGLDHLEGESVAVYADNAAHANVTVTNGQITLAYPATRVIAGLPFTSLIRTLNIIGGSRNGPSIGKPMVVHRVDIDFYNTLECEVGAYLDDTDVQPFRVTSDIMGQAPELFSGIKEMQLNEGFNKEINIVIKQDKPLPMTIRAIVPTYTTADS